MKKSLKSTIFKVFKNRQFSTDRDETLTRHDFRPWCIKFESSSSTPSSQTRVDKVPYIKRDRQTDRRTDGQTDGQTDGRTSSTLYPLVFTGDNYNILNKMNLMIKFICSQQLETLIKSQLYLMITR